MLRGVLLRLAERDHVVALTVHHIASDGWSMGILTREVAALYAAFAAGRPSPLPELPVQYADFAVWQWQRLQGETLAAQLGWWRERLAGAPPFLALPADRPRPAVQRYRGRSQLQQLPLGGAADLARETAATPFMILLAAFGALLGRASGQGDLVIGSPIAGRTRAETEPLIGLFLNTLVLRADLSGDPSFSGLVGRIREVTLGAYANQDLPFEKLVEDLSPERDLSHSPIFQVLFVLQNAPMEPLELPGLRFRSIGSGSATAKFDLVLNATEVDGGLSCQWKYNSDLFDDTRIARLRSGFATLLAAALTDPGRRLSDLPLLSTAERHQTLCEWNDSQTGGPAAVCLQELFAAQAERTPEVVAAVCGDERLTYRDLLCRSRRWAEVLVNRGVGPESVVPILSPRGLPFLTAVLAVLEAGGAYLPLDPQQPAPRALGVLRQSGAGLLLSGGGLGLQLLAAEPAEPPFLKILELEDLARLDGEAATSPAPPVRAGFDPLDSLAYVLYTSGSTGLPKGAMIPHRGLSNHTRITVEVLGLSSADTVAQNAAQSSDISVWQMLSALAIGGRVAIYPDAIAHDPAALLAAVARDGVTVLELVPSLLVAMLEIIEGDAEGEGGSEHDLSRLRWLIPTGEALLPELCRRWLSRYPGIPLLNAYGPTECSDDVSFYPIWEVPADAAWRPAIGRPVANMQLYVVDRDLQPQPLGVPGELCVGGEGLGRGYLGDPVRTALAFVPAPVAGAALGARLYRTGDLGRWRAEGDLEFLGRIDHQVKVRGFRIELGEIEVVLAAHPAVLEAVVDLRGAGAAQRLVAWVTTDATDAAEPSDLLARLRSYLEDRLPGYMIPAAFVLLAAFPRTANGKVDRRALPDPETASAAGAEHAAPRTPLEEYLAGLWRQALAVESVGIHDSFFDLGGNSITGAILMNRLQREMGGVIHVVVLFDAPTVARMAAYLAREEREAVVRLWGEVSLGEAAARAPRIAAGRVDRARLAAFRSVIPPLPPSPDLAAEKNPPAIFLLSPPRAGSTLLRVMLGGHPRLFAPPELELLSFNTLAEREAAFPGRDSFWLEGLIRAVMEVRRCGVEAARQIVGAAVEEGWTTQRFYRQLQEWLGGRTLVDKTTTYALDLAILRRAEEAFEKPFYIHLLRHPYASTRSFEEVKLDELFFRHPHTFERAELAELIWLTSHQNILAHLTGVPEERQIQVRFEDLVRHPEAELWRLCDALGIELDPAMIDPYQEGRARMTDGIHAEGKMLGDVKFLQYKAVEAGVAERSREAREDSLGAPTWETAAHFGYDRPAPLQPAPPALLPRAGGRGEPRPLSFAQQRLWFLDQLEPGSPLYNMPVALRVEGPLDPRVLALTLGEIVRRHEALRTVFVLRDDSPVQVIQPAAPFPLPVVDLAALSPEARELAAEALAGDEAGRPFDLARGPLLRGLLLRLAASDHVFALTLHHIASDGWSMGILVRDVAALYPAVAARRPSPLPELPVQYADFALWQRSWLHGEILEQEISFWRRELSGLPPLLDLPTDRPRPARQSLRGASRPVRLPAGLTRRIEALARRFDATPFMVLLAGFQALLARFSGQDDLAVGSPLAGRNREEIEGLIGFFVNTLVLRGDLSADRDGGPSFHTLLGRVRKTALAAYLHQDVPFEKLVEELAPARSLAHSPLFQVMFALQNAPVESLEIPDLRLSPVQGTWKTAKFDLSLGLAERDGELAGGVEYATDLFDAATVDRWALHFGKLLDAALETPDLPVATLPLLSAAERHQLLREWSDTAALFPEDCLHSIVARQAARTPSAVAVELGAESWTYGRLVGSARLLARHLRTLGVGPDVVVGLCAERSPALVVGMLAVLEAGGAWLPLDAAHPPERLAFLLADAGARVLLLQEPLLERWPATDLPVVLLDGRWDAGEEIGEALGVAVSPDQLAYVIYTSGSTGRPKGVMVPHRGVSNYLRWAQAVYGLAERDVFLQTASPGFDVAVWECFAPLSVGARLVLAEPGRQGDSSYLVRAIREHHVTLVDFVPSMLAAFLAEADVATCVSLRQIRVGGEALPPELRERLLARLPVRLDNMCGPTEVTIDTTRWACAPGPSSRRVPLGRPIANSRLYVVDRGMRPVPIGVAGELLVGGEGVTRGYLRRPDLTAERFVPDPFVGPPGVRLYRSGDLVRFLPDGALDFLGRLDHQVKIRGIRIELGEVEAALVALPGVREAVVAAREDRAGDLGLVAYVVADVPADALGHSLRDQLRERLPDSLVPAAFVTLDALPRTRSGKVDRKALPVPERPNAEAIYVAPKTSVEELLAGIWAELLGIERVGANGDFFELGGHSLLAVRVMARIEHVFGVQVPISALFEAPTVERLAAMIQRGAVPRSTPLVRLHPGGVGRPLFVVHPVGGNVFSYVELAKQLGAKRPVYGLQSVAAGNGHPPSMEHLAAQYLAAVREVQAEGPWLLAGWSSGAITAYEMARQIESAGGTTSLLTMFDPGSPTDGQIRAIGDTALLIAFARMGNPSEEQRVLIREMMEGLDVETGLDRLLALARATAGLPPELGKPWLRERFELFCRTLQTVESYLPRPYDGRVILFRADASLAPGTTDLTAGWDRLARIEAHLIPDADHVTLLQRPALDRLVEHLESALAEVDSESLEEGALRFPRIP